MTLNWLYLYETYPVLSGRWQYRWVQSSSQESHRVRVLLLSEQPFTFTVKIILAAQLFRMGRCFNNWVGKSSALNLRTTTARICSRLILWTSYGELGIPGLTFLLWYLCNPSVIVMKWGWIPQPSGMSSNISRILPRFFNWFRCFVGSIRRASPQAWWVHVAIGRHSRLPLTKYKKYEFCLSLSEPRIIWIRGPVPASTADITMFRGGKTDVSKDQWDKSALYHQVPKGMKGKCLWHLVQLGILSLTPSADRSRWRLIHCRGIQNDDKLSRVPRRNETLDRPLSCSTRDFACSTEVL